LALAEAGIFVAFCLALAVPVGLVATSAVGNSGLLFLLPIAWMPVGWALRCVRVKKDRIIEVRFWPFRRTWSRGSVESLSLIPRTIGWASLPGTSVSMDLTHGDVWFPTLQAWALTNGSLARAERRVEALANELGVPWSDRTEQLRPNVSDE
jgi:hypothetical protein